jgi:hypothetical protein
LAVVSAPVSGPLLEAVKVRPLAPQQELGLVLLPALPPKAKL